MRCFIPCDLAPGLSLPYPSRRFTAPQTPRPAPIAVTKVPITSTPELKNAILIPGSKTHHHPLSFIRNLSIILSPSFGSSELPNFPFFLKNLVYSFISCLNPAQLILGIIIDQRIWASPESLVYVKCLSEHNHLIT